MVVFLYKCFVNQPVFDCYIYLVDEALGASSYAINDGYSEVRVALSSAKEFFQGDVLFFFCWLSCADSSESFILLIMGSGSLTFSRNIFYYNRIIIHSGF